MLSVLGRVGVAAPTPPSAVARRHRRHDVADPPAGGEPLVARHQLGHGEGEVGQARDAGGAALGGVAEPRDGGPRGVRHLELHHRRAGDGDARDRHLRDERCPGRRSRGGRRRGVAGHRDERDRVVARGTRVTGGARGTCRPGRALAATSEGEGQNGQCYQGDAHLHETLPSVNCRTPMPIPWALSSKPRIEACSPPDHRRGSFDRIIGCPPSKNRTQRIRALVRPGVVLFGDPVAQGLPRLPRGQQDLREGLGATEILRGVRDPLLVKSVARARREERPRLAHRGRPRGSDRGVPAPPGNGELARAVVEGTAARGRPRGSDRAVAAPPGNGELAACGRRRHREIA